jgi:amiloride-sensitive sodium channel
MQPNHAMVLKNNKLANFLLEYSKENLAILRVLFKDPYYMLIKRDEQMSMLSFLGNTGGLLGLCMGMSLVSIFEIVYHLLCFLNDIILKMVRQKTFN